MLKEFGYFKIVLLLLMLAMIFITGENHFGFQYEF